MVVTSELLTNLRKSYNKVRSLIEGSRFFATSDPRANQQAARLVLLKMRDDLNNSPATKSLSHANSISASIALNLGVIAIDVQEPAEGEKEFTTCLELLHEKELNEDSIILTIMALNQLGILWSNRNNPLESKKFLDRSEMFYKKFKNSNKIPIDTVDIFLETNEIPELQSKNKLEKTHTLTLFYLAQIYGVLDDDLKAAVYCHTTLKRQLEFKDYDPVDWILNCATLSQFFIEKSGFKQARHHLAASSYILDDYEKKFTIIHILSDSIETNLENLQRISADVARCWTKYGLALLSISKERLLNSDNEDTTACSLSSDFANLHLSDNSAISITDISQLTFSFLDLTLYENQISSEFVLTFDDAKLIFLKTNSWIDKSTSYYTLENLASDYLKIMQDASQLYKLVAFFVESDDTKAKMHKRRINLLEKAIKDINPTYYMMYLRQIWGELASTYQDILNIKSELLKTNENPSSHVINKINHCIESSIKYLKKYLDSLKQPNGEMPQKFTPDHEHPALSAYFQIGSLYLKFIVFDKKTKLVNSEETLKAYQSLVTYCDVNTSSAEQMQTELKACKEMIELLPLKIKKLKRSVEQQQ